MSEHHALTIGGVVTHTVMDGLLTLTITSAPISAEAVPSVARARETSYRVVTIVVATSIAVAALVNIWREKALAHSQPL